MKQTIPFLSPEETVADLARFAWCALVAVQLASRDGLASSPFAVHTFLLRWLATAQKQKRFPRSVASDITSLLDLGRRKGPGANLHDRLDYLWRSCSAPLTTQSELFRLTWSIEKLKSQGWCNAVVNDSEWNAPGLLDEYRTERALLVCKSLLQQQFTDDGTLEGDIPFLLNGDVASFTAILAEANLEMVVREHDRDPDWFVATMYPPSL
ncbi:TPA: DUF2913 family protein [Enterobacter hormaechei subsp. steigerwaltii]|nr:DUF2913 family protein [Enterobacter hormaechei subsp. steigerwaltii]